MEKCLKISIITPSFNQADFIEENILSVINQNYYNFEHIIMDGGSTDNTVEILKKYPHLIWKSEKDRGQTHALNKALKIAKGDIIGWLNSDDMYCENVFSIVNDYFILNPDKHILTGNLLNVDSNNKILWETKAKKIEYNRLLNTGQNVQQPSTFFRSIVFQTIGYFDEKYHYCMDHEFWVRAAQRYNFNIINKNFSLFRRHHRSKTTENELGFVKDLIRIKREYKGKIFTMYNFQLLFMFIKEPFKRIKWLRIFVQKLKNRKKVI